MAHIYAGDTSKIDEEVLRVAERLPDDFWVFAEFDIERNIDWLVLREVPASERANLPSTMIVTELKRSDKPIRAWNMNGPWEKLEDSGVYIEVHNDKPEVNFYQQVLHTSSTLQDWLWRNQRFYLDSHLPVQPIDSFKPWPDLLLLSPPGVRHQLPMRPPTGYGGFWFGVEQWVNHIQRWNPRAGYSWSPEELTKLAEFLGLKQIASPKVSVPTPSTGNLPREVGEFAAWVLRLEERVSQLERQVQAMTSGDGNSANGVGGTAASTAQVPTTDAPAQAYRSANASTFGDTSYTPGQQLEGRIYRISPQRDYVLASLADGFTVLLHISKMSENFQRRLNLGQVQLGAPVRVEVLQLDRDRGQVRLEVRDVGTPPPVASPDPTSLLLPGDEPKPLEESPFSW
ncbi:MAG: S1 RNA-binding domain-containing protein [Chloroflexi bacterium]|nr:S1 RNA-binding domain-containing protein [Chloroflexota bacterium]